MNTPDIQSQQAHPMGVVSNQASSSSGVSVAKESKTFDTLVATTDSHPRATEMSDEEEVFFDANPHFDSSLSHLSERLHSSLQSLKEALPALNMTLPSISNAWNKLGKSMADSIATQNFAKIMDKANQHSCKLATPFEQMSFIYAKRVEDPEFSSDYGKISNSPGQLCLGLSATWLQNKIQGHDSQTFLEKLNDHKKDATMARALGIQHVEQQKYPDKIKNAEKMLNDILPMVGLKIDVSTALPGKQAHYGLEVEQMDILKQKVITDGKEQNMLLLSSYHAMAMHKSENGKMEFFDPVFGIVTAENKDDMLSFLKDIAENNTTGTWGSNGLKNSFQLTEVVANKAIINGLNFIETQ